MSQQDHYIDGNWIEGKAEKLNSINPATAKILWQGNSATPVQMDNAIVAARQAFGPWMSLSLDARYNLLQKFVHNLTTQQENLAETLSQETGKPLWESKTEITAMIGKLEISKQAYQDRCKEYTKDLQGVTSITRHKPHGVVLVLGPFNFPGHLPNGHIIPALLAGNTVIVKPSEFTPYISYKIMQCWQAAGLPAGVINMIQGAGDVGKYLVDHQDIDALIFTGSSATGQKIQETSLKHSSRILALEMGGNNPLVVYKPDNIAAAVYNCIQSAFITAGQRCTCARRLIVVKDKQGEDFVASLIKAITQIKVGPCTDQPEPFMGTVISNAAAEHILAEYQKLVQAGVMVLVPMTRLQPNLAFLTPSLIDVTNLVVPDEEIFGPLLKLTWVTDFETAIKEANNTKYGLSAGIFTSQAEIYQQFYQQIRAGIVNWNRPLTGASSSAPFGGIGCSGNHRPSAYYAADYCAYPVVSSEDTSLKLPASLAPGIVL